MELEVDGRNAGLIQPSSVHRFYVQEGERRLVVRERDRVVLELTESLIQAEETACLSRLSDYVSRLPDKELKKLARLINKQPGIPKSFQSAVEQALTTLPPKKGLKGALRAVWRRLPGRE